MAYGMGKEELLQRFGESNRIKVGARGHVTLIDLMGNDEAHVRAARVSYGNGTKTVREDRALIRYLVRHAHSSPLEMSEIVFHIKAPIHVVRQIVRHRTASMNEESLRYSVVKDEFEFTEADEWRLQSKDNKQGSSGLLSDRDAVLADLYSQEEASLLSSIKGFYHRMVDVGVAREMARKILPLSTYTEFFWKIDVRNLFHFLKLRLDSHAQQEIREFAQAIYQIVQLWIPLTTEAFNDYQLNAAMLSAQEIAILMEYFSVAEDVPRLKTLVAADPTLSSREKTSFLSLLGL